MNRDDTDSFKSAYEFHMDNGLFISNDMYSRIKSKLSMSRKNIEFMEKVAKYRTAWHRKVSNET